MWEKGKKFSEEHIKKLSLAKKGKKLSGNHRKNISTANKGKIFSGEHRKKIGLAHKGKKLSEETKKKISCSEKGKVVSEETRLKLSKLNSGKGNPFHGKHHTQEAKNAIRDKNKLKIKSSKMTTLEIKFEAICKKNSLPYRFVGNGAFWIENCNPDFIDADGEKKAVEVYCSIFKNVGGSSEEEYRLKRNTIFNKYGWTLVFFNENELAEEQVIGKLLPCKAAQQFGN